MVSDVKGILTRTPSFDAYNFLGPKTFNFIHQHSCIAPTEGWVSDLVPPPPPPLLCTGLLYVPCDSQNTARVDLKSQSDCPALSDEMNPIQSLRPITVPPGKGKKGSSSVEVNFQSPSRSSSVPSTIMLLSDRDAVERKNENRELRTRRSDLCFYTRLFGVAMDTNECLAGWFE